MPNWSILPSKKDGTVWKLQTFLACVLRPGGPIRTRKVLAEGLLVEA